MRFKKLRGIRLSYEEQGLIYFLCSNFKNLTKKEQQKITDLCQEVGGAYKEALLDFLTGDSAVKVSLDHSVSESNLYRMRKEFYEKFK